MEHKKIEQDLPVRKFKVESNGDVVMDETNHIVITYAGREFLSFFRKHEQSKEQLEKDLSEKHLNLLKEGVEDLTAQIEELKPIVKEVDELLQTEYLREQKAANIKRLREVLSNPEEMKLKGIQQWVVEAWKNGDEEFKSRFTAEETQVIAKLLQKKKRGKL